MTGVTAGFRRAGLLFAVLCVLPGAARSQDVTLVAVIYAAERDSAMSDAVVTLNGTRIGVTDATGTVRFAGVQPGPHFVWIRRIGWRPVTMVVTVPAGREEVRVGVRLRALPIRLDPIEIVAERGTARLAREGFFQRQELGFGHFITRADILRRDPHRTSMLLEVLPPRFRQSCALWIDGVPAETLGDILRAVDLMLPPQTIAGMEMYAGGANTPVRFNVTRGRCSVVVWTR